MDFVVSSVQAVFRGGKQDFGQHYAVGQHWGRIWAGFGQHLGSIGQYFRKHLGRIEILIKHVDLGTV